MKNKGKITYLTFMTLGLAIVMLISSSITLAYFGASAKGSATIKMGNAVTVGHATTVESQTIYVSPSEMVDVDAAATVKSPGDEDNTTDAILRAKITSSLPNTNIAVVATSTFGTNTAYWKDGGDGYFYLVETEGGNICKTIETTTTGVVIPMKISAIIPSELNNSNGGDQFTLEVVFCAIQARIYDDTGLTPIVNSITNTSPIFEQVENY